MHSLLKKLFICTVWASCGLAAHQLDQEYSKDFTDLIELVYGKGLLSQGGYQSIDTMFVGIDLNGKKVLDIGSGLGGVDLYLAQQYCVDVMGIDCVQRMVTDAQERVSKVELKGSVRFLQVEPDHYPYPYEDNSFDIIFSKEAMLHVSNKEPLIKELYRVLRPGGQLIILDWLIESIKLGPHITHMMQVDNLDLKMATPQEYQTCLVGAGFESLGTTLMNAQYTAYTTDNIVTLQTHKQALMSALGAQAYEYCLKSWGIQKRIFELSEVLVTLIKGQKPFDV